MKQLQDHKLAFLVKKNRPGLVIGGHLLKVASATRVLENNNPVPGAVECPLPMYFELDLSEFELAQARRDIEALGSDLVEIVDVLEGDNGHEDFGDYE